VDREKVSSSNIDSIGYDPAEEVLEVSFKSGSVYQYHGVPATAYSNLIQSKSIGGHLHRNIIGVYPQKRIG
jgi:hypothetical protein